MAQETDHSMKYHAFYVTECNPVTTLDIQILRCLANESDCTEVTLVPIGRKLTNSDQVSAFQRFVLANLAVDTEFSEEAAIQCAKLDFHRAPTYEMLKEMAKETDKVFLRSDDLNKYLESPMPGDPQLKFSCTVLDENTLRTWNLSAGNTLQSLRTVLDHAQECKTARNAVATLASFFPVRVAQAIVRYGWYDVHVLSSGILKDVATHWKSTGDMKALSNNSSNARIAVFGGSFNPITNGHLNAVHALAARDDIDAVWLVPCGPRPDKPTLRVSTGERIVQVFNAIEESFSAVDHVYVVPIEYWETRALASIELLPRLQDMSKISDSKFSLVIGADLLQSISSWHHSEELLHSHSFIIVNRPGYAQESTDMLQSEMSRVFPEATRQRSTVVAQPVSFDVSSSEVRALINKHSQNPSTLYAKLGGILPRTVIRRLRHNSTLRAELAH